MTLMLKPRGRGNWSVVTMQVDSRRLPPMLVQAGQLFFFGGVTWRVCKVWP